MYIFSKNCDKCTLFFQIDQYKEHFQSIFCDFLTNTLYFHLKSKSIAYGDKHSAISLLLKHIAHA